ncbi:MAG: protein kinase [Proteobacteria bacterium]|nr:protein kinase [Pseudomonadota bacterium]
MPPPSAQPATLPGGDETVIVPATLPPSQENAGPPQGFLTPAGGGLGEARARGGSQSAAPPQGGDETVIVPPPTFAGDETVVVAGTPTTAPATLGALGTLTGLPARTLPPQATGAADAGVVKQVGRYLVQGRLGRGGMATVYRATDPSIGRDVAIKFLHASLAEDAECHARFLREARAAGGLSHPHIAVVHDVGEIGGRPYMAMELIDGQTLGEALDKKPAMPIRDAVAIGIQLARALDYAHARGVVHRDIKPGNIMLLADGKTVKVTDFGIAHMDEGDNQRTQVGAVIGTPQYMSPEQTRGDKLDGRSDLFSAGVVLYQMVTGERPFKGESLVAVATRIATEQPPPVTQARPDAPAALRRVIERCLAKPPGQRYQSGEELAEALTAVLAEIDAKAARAHAPRIVSLRVRWALAMACVVAVVMGITATLINQRQYAALMGQATDYGASLARFIARQNAAEALREEWEVVGVAVDDMMLTGNFERIVVIDAKGTVRASSIPALVGKPYQAAGTESLGKLAGDTQAVRYAVQGEPVLGFEAPIEFQDHEVGRVALGIPEKPLTQVARLAVTLMVVLVLVTIAAVGVAMFVLGDRFAKPIRLVRHAMGQIAAGGLSVRIAEARKDEFGLLFNAFDQMANTLQRREAEQATEIAALKRQIKAEPMGTHPADAPTDPPAAPAPTA